MLLVMPNAKNNSSKAPSVRQVTVGEAVIEYRVEFSQRRKKTIQIAVKAEGVVVTAPSRTPARELRDLVIRRADWIQRRLAEWGERVEPEPPAMVSGTILPYLGQSLELVVELQPAGAKSVTKLPVVSRCGDKLHIKALVGPSGVADPEALRGTLIGWYQAQAYEQVRAAVDKWWPALGRGEFPNILIGNQRRRWGSCAPDGTLRFTWRLAMVAPELIEYVAVHELAHLTHMNHSPRFWGLVTEHLPDVKARRQRLTAAGRELPLL